VQIVVAPPSDPGSPGHEELAEVGAGEHPPPAGDFLDRSWLRQERAARGSQLQTIGLSIHAGHPELELRNLPTALTQAGVELLEKLAGYVLAGGRLDDGELMQMDEGLPSLVGFEPTDGGDSLLVVFIS
jgi:hypothetical protein